MKKIPANLAYCLTALSFLIFSSSTLAGVLESWNSAMKAYQSRDYEKSVNLITKAIEENEQSKTFTDKDLGTLFYGRATSRSGMYFMKKNSLMASEEGKDMLEEILVKTVQDYTKAFSLGVKDQQLLIGLGGAHLELYTSFMGQDIYEAITGRDHLVAAKTYLTLAIENDPNASALYGNRCVALTMLLEIDPAIKDCEKAIEMDPNNKEARRWLQHLQEKYTKSP